MMSINSFTHCCQEEFKCGGINPLIEDDSESISCVGSHIICDDNNDDDDEDDSDEDNNDQDDDERYCIIDCFNKYNVSSSPELCGSMDAGCCSSYIECPDNGLCEIKCSYSCNNLTINAMNANKLLIEECKENSCNNLTIYCPYIDEDNSCKIESNSKINDLDIFIKYHDNINIIYQETISGNIHCIDNYQLQCNINSDDPSFCNGTIPNICDYGFDEIPTNNPTLKPITNLPTMTVLATTKLTTTTTMNQDKNEWNLTNSTNLIILMNESIESTDIEKEIESENEDADIDDVGEIMKGRVFLQLIVISAVSVSIIMMITILCLKWHNNSIYDLDEITITKNNENELEIIKYEFEMMKQVYFEKLKGLNTDKKENEQEEKQQELKQDDDDDIDDDEDDVDIEQMYDKPATFETDTTGLMGE